MRCFAYATLLLAAAALASAAVARNEDEETSQERYRLRSSGRSIGAQGRTFSQLFNKGCPPATSTETFVTTEPPETFIDTDTHIYTFPASHGGEHGHGSYEHGRGYNLDSQQEDDLLNDDDQEFDDDNDNDNFELDDSQLNAFDISAGSRRRQLFENNSRQLEQLRRQEETNKLLRQQIDFMRRQSVRNQVINQRARRNRRRRNNSIRRQAARRQQMRRLNRRLNRIARRNNRNRTRRPF